MPKITAGGGASNVREELDPAVPSVAPSSAPSDDGATVELTREEDPNAPAPRPGEHTVFFAGSAQVTDEPPGEEVTGDGTGEALPPVEEQQGVEVEAPPATPRKAAKKVTRGPAA